MSHALRVLRVEFGSHEDLDREYHANLVNGGLFIPGHFELLYGEPVLVFVDLPFVGASIELEGCIVQCIPVELEANGGQSGVAVELRSSPLEIRDRLEDLVGEPFHGERTRRSGNRYAPRSIAHVRARVRIPGAIEMEGRTRDLSLAGVLVAISDEAPPVGQKVTVAIVHPTSGEERSIRGVIARHDLDEWGQACGLGIQFAVEPEESDDVIAYLSQVKASEHSRRLGGITGTIETLGLQDLLLSFGQCVPRGRFTLLRDGQVGTVFVESRMIESVQIGAASGIKALVRMLAWESGNFEFHPNIEPDVDGPFLSMPIEAALMEAARFLDESRRYPDSGLPRLSGLRVEQPEVDLGDPTLSKIEQQILDLARVGMTVSRLLDTIQEPDGLIERSILDLVERGTLQLENGYDDL